MSRQQQHAGRLSASALARALSRDRNGVAAWLRAGCPTDLPGAVAWLEARAAARAREPLERKLRELEAAAGGAGAGVAESEWRARKRAAEAGLRELELAQRRGELVRRVDVTALWAERIKACKSRVREIPKRLVVLVPGFTRAMAAKTAELIDETLRELAGDGAPRPGSRARRRAAP